MFDEAHARREHDAVRIRDRAAVPMSAEDVSAALMILAPALADATLVFGLRRGGNRSGFRAPWTGDRPTMSRMAADRMDLIALSEFDLSA